MSSIPKEMQPELIIGLVGPIGVDMDSVSEVLSTTLSNVGYRAHSVRVSDLMKSISVDVALTEKSYFEKYKSLIEYGNKVSAKGSKNYVMAALAILEIQKKRAEVHKELHIKKLRQEGNVIEAAKVEADTAPIENGSNLPALGNAYIIRQFKRPDEIDMMRATYGRKFVLVSVYASEQERKERLIKKIKSYNDSEKTDADCEKEAIDLISLDFNEYDQTSGQRIAKIFHLGDVFVYGLGRTKIESTIKRFIEAFFGDNAKSPNRDEYGLYMASAASLRSVDLSRQIGASIFSPEGEILALGSNEVPKAFGGTYWDEEGQLYRDIELGHDTNQLMKRTLLNDLLEKMEVAGYLSESFLKESKKNDGSLNYFLQDSNGIKTKIMDIIEFGRMIHAEMNAITDAARVGHSIRGSVMYSTTFPCHICAKHIVSSGIKRVVFLEPYPKSYAKDFHSDSITFDVQENKNKVLFEPFIGISPRRYRDIFEKNKRKDDKTGKSKKWKVGYPAPSIEDRSPSHLAKEEEAISFLEPIIESNKEQTLN